tara:strand:- start:3999 stop:4622 length:624 start_codon:yes stop_codon:yes gene_type:complete
MKPSYYAIIPAEVRYSDLKPNAKLLYGEITALSSKEGYCFATNNYFAKLYNVTKNTVSLWVSQLHSSGFISVELIKKGEQITERRIGIIKNDERANTKNDDLSSIKINNTSNNIYLRREKFKNDISLLDYDQKFLKEFFDYWSEPTKSKSNPKMRFELEKTWLLDARVKRWMNNVKKWSTKKTSNSFKSKMDTYSRAKEMMNQINNK